MIPEPKSMLPLLNTNLCELLKVPLSIPSVYTFIVIIPNNLPSLHSQRLVVSISIILSLLFTLSIACFAFSKMFSTLSL